MLKSATITAVGSFTTQTNFANQTTLLSTEKTKTLLDVLMLEFRCFDDVLALLL
jgi:hypothetical protein